MTEFVQIKKRERSALRFRCAQNPNRELLWLELFDLRRRPFRKFVLFKIDIFRLQTLLAYFEATPARVAKKPESIARGFAVCCQLRGFAPGRVKNLLRFGRV